MVQILMLLLIFLLGAGLLFLANRFLGKAGLYSFIVFCIILANYQAYATFALGGITIVPSICLSVLMFIGLLVCFNRYGKNSAMTYFVICIVAACATQIMGIFINILAEITVDWATIKVALASIIATTASTLVLLLLVAQFKKNGKDNYLTTYLALAITVFVDAIVFIFIVNVSVMPFGELCVDIFHNWWQKLIVAALGTFALWLISRYQGSESKELK